MTVSFSSNVAVSSSTTTDELGSGSVSPELYAGRYVKPAGQRAPMPIQVQAPFDISIGVD